MDAKEFYMNHCPYCDTTYSVEFGHEDDELLYCPSCGEQIPEFDPDEDLIEDLYEDE